MERINNINETFDCKVAIEQSKINKNKFNENIILKIYNECIIPAINKGIDTCTYEHRGGDYLNCEIEKYLKDKGFMVINISNVAYNISWS